MMTHCTHTSLGSRVQRGFTLIELLVVIGIIVLLLGSIGLALKGSNPSNALQTGQGIVSSMLNSARGQAILKQQNAGVFVNMNPPTPTNPNPDRYLRHLVVAVDTSAAQDGSGWTPIDDGVTLPTGVYVVPKDTSPTTVFYYPNAAAFAALNSSALSANTTLSVNSSTAEPYAYFSITPLGTTSSGNIVLSTARSSPGAGNTTTLTFDNANNVRGISISPYGIATLINESASF